MTCPECGHELDSNNVCQNPNCITRIKNDQLESNTKDNIYNSSFNANTNNFYSPENPNTEFRDANGISPVEMMEFIGYKNTEYYMDKWTRFQNNPKFISWNWPAFLFGIFWFWFRKMYNIAGIIFAVNLSSLLLVSHFGWLRSIISLAITIGSGLLANQLYMNHATEKIKTAKFAKSIGFDNNMLLKRLNSIGGVTWIPLVVGIILFVILIVFIIVFSIALSSRLGGFKF